MNGARVNNRTLRFIGLVLILIIGLYLGRIFKLDVELLREYLARFPLILSGLIFVVLYVVSTTFIWFGPKDVLRITSAVLFGATVSTVFVWVAETVNAGIMFHLSQSLGRDYVRQKLGVHSGKLEQMKDRSSVLGILAWRINPLIPFRLMDLGYGLTAVPFPKYLWSILAVSLVRIFWLQYILAAIGDNIFKDLNATMAYFTDNVQIVRMSAYYFMAVILVTVMSVAERLLKKWKGNH